MNLEFSGSPEIHATRDHVWRRLLDPHFIARSAPGVERVEPLDATHFRMTLGLGVALLKLRLAFDVEMFDLVEGRPGIQRLSRSGGDAVRLVESPSSVFAVRDGFVYAIDVDERVVRVHAAGGEPEVLVDMPVTGLAVDDPHLYFTQGDALSDLVLFRTPLP